MQISADKLLALKPHLILTGKAVGRHAQEHLRRHKVGSWVLTDRYIRIYRITDIILNQQEGGPLKNPLTAPPPPNKKRQHRWPSSST